ncbi:hypothetical protein DUI87_28716 [Hirundo rustica rustica]|uniref:RNase H type-1 domain-containing protein n=1 Tax=Hirundo rustica rustica TaxID=333673 RepID=A0A3M0J3M2_HIRRU|nr:hypothetical protein DUI87_28716 [Hirundo rustica rustica]
MGGAAAAQGRRPPGLPVEFLGISVGFPKFSVEFPKFAAIFPKFPVEFPEFSAKFPEFPEEFPEFSVEFHEFSAEFPEFLVKFPKFPVELPEFPLKFPKFLVEFPEFLAEFPEFPVRFPEFPVEFPKFLVEFPEFLVKFPKFPVEFPEFPVELSEFPGYRISQKKAQMVKQTVIYLGYEHKTWARVTGQSPEQLHAAAKERPGCLRAIAAVAVNTQEAPKFTLGQKMTVPVSHTVSAVLKVKGGHWPSPQRFLKYQAIMVEQDDVEIVVTNTVNPASFLSGGTGEPVIHECLEAIEATCSSCLDLKDTLLENTETWSTDGSSCVTSGRHAGYVVTMSREVIESGPLPTNTSAQKAEITALTRALELAKGKKVNIYPDLTYAFGVVHALGAVWKERIDKKKKY